MHISDSQNNHHFCGISEQKNDDERSAKNDSNFRMFFENASDGIVYLDRNAVVRASNKKIEDLFGYSKEEILGKPFTDFAIFSPDDMDKTYGFFCKSVEGKLPPRLEFEGYHKAGKRFYLEINPTLVRDQEQLVGLIAVIRDITSRKQAEEERSRLIDIIEATPDIVLTYDSYGNASYINRAGREFFGLSSGDGFNMDILPSIKDELPELMRTGIWTGETQVVSARDICIHASQVIMSHVRNSSDKSYYSMILRDITEQKQNENHIKHLTRHLLKVQEDERSRIARDLHDKLAQDLSSLKIIGETLFDAHVEVPRGVRDKISEMSRIFKQSIDSVRDLTYNLRPASLHELGLVKTLGRMCEEFQEQNRRILFFSAGMNQLKLDFDTEINLYRISQEIFNNIKNHAGATCIKMNITASYPTIILQIEDNGAGFDLIQRKKHLIQEKRMGLKSIEERVGLLNGKCRIHSKVGVGTMIHVEVPYKPEWYEQEPGVSGGDAETACVGNSEEDYCR